MRITVIHTTAATIRTIPALIMQEIPEAEVFNILDDSILPDMNNQVNIEWVRERWLGYVDVAVRNGAQAILSACSTVGEFAQEANQTRQVPVYRIDEAMACTAVARGGVICVLATLRSTLGPTIRLLHRIMQEQSVQCTVLERFVEGAYDALMDGDQAAHDRKILQAISSVDGEVTTFVLAQASMEGALAHADPSIRGKVLTSPLLGIRKLRDDLKQQESKQ